MLNIHSFSSIAGPAAKSEDQTKAAEPEQAKKPAKEPRFIKEASLITTEEFESVPAWVNTSFSYSLAHQFGQKTEVWGKTSSCNWQMCWNCKRSSVKHCSNSSRGDFVQYGYTKKQKWWKRQFLVDLDNRFVKILIYSFWFLSLFWEGWRNSTFRFTYWVLLMEFRRDRAGTWQFLAFIKS